MNNLCEECKGKCCVGIIDVYSNDTIYYDETLVEESIDTPYDRRMKTDQNNRCICLDENGKCTIYDKRPLVCREFSVGCSCCENFRKGYLLEHKCLPCKISELL